MRWKSAYSHRVLAIPLMLVLGCGSSREHVSTQNRDKSPMSLDVDVVNAVPREGKLVAGLPIVMGGRGSISEFTSISGHPISRGSLVKIIQESAARMKEGEPMDFYLMSGDPSQITLADVDKALQVLGGAVNDSGIDHRHITAHLVIGWKSQF